MVTAIVMIDTRVDAIDSVAQRVAEIDAVTDVYSVTGPFDLVAIVRVPDHHLLAGVVAGGINKIPGVIDTDTHIAFRAYPRRDLDAGFALGAGDAD